MPGHVFLVLHAPLAGAAGHVHYIELDQFIGERFLVTVHGPLNPAADPAAARVEVDAVLKRLESGRLRGQEHAFELAYAIVSALVRPAARIRRGADGADGGSWNTNFKMWCGREKHQAQRRSGDVSRSGCSARGTG